MITMYPTVKVKRLDDGIPTPKYAKAGDAGMDLRVTETVTVNPHETVLVGTGVAMAIPDGFFGDVRPRSGTATKRGITVANTPGTIDGSFRGEIKLALHNIGTRPQTIERGERVAQILFLPVATATLVTVDELDSTERGSGSFGSSGRI